jgi:hypothetical protein
MHDMSLGAPVDVGSYDGPFVDGQPLHGGNCEDGVYGCRKCGDAARNLSDETLRAIGWSLTQSCDWCRKDTPIRRTYGLQPWDEPGCYYEVCNHCYQRYKKSEPVDDD